MKKVENKRCVILCIFNKEGQCNCESDSVRGLVEKIKNMIDKLENEKEGLNNELKEKITYEQFKIYNFLAREFAIIEMSKVEEETSIAQTEGPRETEETPQTSTPQNQEENEPKITSIGFLINGEEKNWAYTNELKNLDLDIKYEGCESIKCDIKKYNKAIRRKEDCNLAEDYFKKANVGKYSLIVYCYNEEGKIVNSKSKDFKIISPNPVLA